MFSKKNNRFMNPNQNYMDYNYQVPYNMPIQGNGNIYNPYDLARIDEQLNEFKRLTSDLSRRITRVENYLGIRSETDASNYQ